MCLTVHLSLTKKFREEHPNPEEEVVVYKILCRKNKDSWQGVFNIFDTKYNMRLHRSICYETPWMCTEVSLDETLYAYPQYYYPPYKWKLFNEQEITSGAIHTYCDLVTAQENITDNKEEIIVKCTAKMADFIACGYHGDICFTKILITNEVFIYASN